MEGLGGLTHSYEKLTVRVPTCGPCLREVERRQQHGRWAGAGIGLLVVVFGTLLVLPGQAAMNQAVLLLLGALVAVIVTMAGFVIGAWVADRRLPARAGRYSGSKNTIALWFRQPAFADSLRVLLQKQAALDAGAALSCVT
jgi:hypothetical protein